MTDTKQKRPIQTSEKIHEHAVAPRWNRYLLILGIVFYLASLPLDFFVVTADWSPDVRYWEGYFVLKYGWLGVAESQYAWFANVFLYFSWYRLYKVRKLSALVTIVLAAIFSIDGFLFWDQPIEHFRTGECCMYFNFAIGAYFWYMAIFVQLLCSILSFIKCTSGIYDAHE